MKTELTLINNHLSFDCRNPYHVKIYLFLYSSFIENKELYQKFLISFGAHGNHIKTAARNGYIWASIIGLEPNKSMQQVADEFNISRQHVRNVFVRISNHAIKFLQRQGIKYK